MTSTLEKNQIAIPHLADSHDLIRVRGARENNLKNVNVELPKRRLTVFTGVSARASVSLVLSTIAAESQRMINETYSAFVQGFMPTMNRPDVDLLEGLTTAIIVDQERMVTSVRPSARPPIRTRCCVSSSAGSDNRISARPTPFLSIWRRSRRVARSWSKRAIARARRRSRLFPPRAGCAHAVRGSARSAISISPAL